MSERWLTFGQASEIIRARLDASVGRSEAVLQAARTSGEVRTQEPVFLNDDGVVGLRLRQISVRRFSEADLLDWLGRHHPEQRAPGRRGRPSHDWSKISAAAFELMDHHGEFSNDDPKWNAQARLEEALSDQFSVGISTLREHLPKLLDDWRKAKAGK
jgi:hypothetical protein